MNITLMAAVPCKRFDFSPLCKDGRGGWTFSQFGADRYVAEPRHLAIKLGLAVYATPVVTGDYVEQSELIAKFNGQTIGTNRLDWRIPNNGGAHHTTVSVYEWIQEVDAPITDDGLIAIAIRIKLHSQPAFIDVNGTPFVHATIRDTNDPDAIPG